MIFGYFIVKVSTRSTNNTYKSYTYVFTFFYISKNLWLIEGIAKCTITAFNILNRIFMFLKTDKQFKIIFNSRYIIFTLSITYICLFFIITSTNLYISITSKFVSRAIDIYCRLNNFLGFFFNITIFSWYDPRFIVWLKNMRNTTYLYVILFNKTNNCWCQQIYIINAGLTNTSTRGRFKKAALL